MYQLWKNIRRAPNLYDPKYFGGIFLGYVGFSIAKTYHDQFQGGHGLYQTHHSGSYEEERRQYAERVMLENRATIFALRKAKLDLQSTFQLIKRLRESSFRVIAEVEVEEDSNDDE